MAEFEVDVGKQAQFEAPTIADLMRKIYGRPHWQADEPLEIDADTFERAEREMREIQRRQGRTLAVAPWVAGRNFLLRGVAVVTHE